MNHSYEPPGLLPAEGQERTYALAIAGAPLLLILLMVFMLHLASGEDSAAGATSVTGQGGYSYEPQPTDSWTPDTSTAYGTEPSAPTAGDDATDLYPSTLDTQSTDTTPSTDSTDGTTGPAATVTRFFDAINAHDFQTAWELGGKNLDESYDAFQSGFATTEHDEVTVESVEGDTVSVSLVAQQTDGTEKSFSGQYTVADGVITHATMASAG
ncbi:hypothetical protein ACWC0C_30530 [Streptomyces sp. NPDC001709]